MWWQKSFDRTFKRENWHFIGQWDSGGWREIGHLQPPQTCHSEYAPKRAAHDVADINV
jgi:hypothetical protein